VSRFKLGDAAEPSVTPVQPMAAPARDNAPQPIRVRPKSSALPPAVAAAIATTPRKPAPGKGGDWEEF
jgi:hypothetical protein